MKHTTYILLAGLSLLFLSSCSENEARKPISRATGTFMKESVERNKKIISSEEKIIDSIIKSQPEKKYYTSSQGFWYTYINRNETDTIRPKKGDVVTFEYDVNDLQNNVIYTALELRPQTYRVDKENIMTGLKDGIKLMRKNETVEFLFPSNIAYGFYGDKNRIGTNVSLKCTVTLTSIAKDTKTKSKTENNNLVNNETND
jgi:gliding motility-associated peptidyl-prolyl isomerase